MHYPKLKAFPSHTMWTEQFTGLDRRPRAYDGAFDAMGNMTGESWPLLCSRKKRGIVAELEQPLGLMAMEKLAWIDGSTLYYGGEPTPITNLSLSADMLPKQMVSMGAYLLVFPDGVYCSTVDMSDCGSINRLYASPAGQPVTFSLCTLEGQDYPRGRMTVSAAEPQEPETGDYWLDTSEKTHVLHAWNGEWTAVSSVYVRIGAPGIGRGLKDQDGVTLSGIQYIGSDEALKAQFDFLNAAHIVQAVDEDWIVISGVIDQNYTQAAGCVRADRKAPAMDFVIECNNRLWGCRYGKQDGQTVNMMYACALGDFTNWQKFAGTSQDSYFAHLGSDGPFTGAVEWHDVLSQCPRRPAVRRLAGVRQQSAGPGQNELRRGRRDEREILSVCPGSGGRMEPVCAGHRQRHLASSGQRPRVGFRGSERRNVYALSEWHTLCTEWHNGHA